MIEAFYLLVLGLEQEGSREEKHLLRNGYAIYIYIVATRNPEKRGEAPENQLFMGTSGLPFMNCRIALCELLCLFPRSPSLRPNTSLISGFAKHFFSTFLGTRFWDGTFRSTFLAVLLVRASAPLHMQNRKN